MYDAAEGEDKKILMRVLRQYGAYKLGSVMTCHLYVII